MDGSYATLSGVKVEQNRYRDLFRRWWADTRWTGLLHLILLAHPPSETQWVHEAMLESDQPEEEGGSG